MARPTLLLTGAGYYQPGYLEEHWPRLLERCDAVLRVGGASAGADEMVALAERDGKQVFTTVGALPPC